MDSKILILLPIWKRENITKICFDNLKELQKKYNIEVMCVISETWAKMLAFEYGFKYVEAPNDCLGTKMNIGVEAALKCEFDYFMNLGSDDIITERLIEIYKPFIDDKRAMFGSTKATFIDSQSKSVKRLDYKFMFGAGRMIRKDVLVDCVVKNGVVEMYDKVQNGLDMSSMRRFAKYSHTELDNGFDTVFDIKSNTNIWTYDRLKGDSVDFEEGTKGLSTKQIDEILEL